jgi:hypothetical protein
MEPADELRVETEAGRQFALIVQLRVRWQGVRADRPFGTVHHDRARRKEQPQPNVVLA